MFGSNKEEVNENLPIQNEEVKTVQNTVETQTSEEQPKESKEVENTSNDSVAPKKKPKITPTYTVPETKVEGEITTSFSGAESAETEEYKAEVKAAEEEEDIKVEQNNDSSYTIDDNTSDKDKAQVNNEKGSVDTGNEEKSWSDIANGDNVTVQKQKQEK